MSPELKGKCPKPEPGTKKIEVNNLNIPGRSLGQKGK